MTAQIHLRSDLPIAVATHADLPLVLRVGRVGAAFLTAAGVALTILSSLAAARDLPDRRTKLHPTRNTHSATARRRSADPTRTMHPLFSKHRSHGPTQDTTLPFTRRRTDDATLHSTGSATIPLCSSRQVEHTSLDTRFGAVGA